MNSGSIKLTFILTESVKLISEELLENGVLSIQVDGDVTPSKYSTKINKASLSPSISLTIMLLLFRLLLVKERCHGFVQQQWYIMQVVIEMF